MSTIEKGFLPVNPALGDAADTAEKRSGEDRRKHGEAQSHADAAPQAETATGAAAPTAPAADPLWYKDAVIYQLHVKSFFDCNNDGIGDFAGLIAKLDYIASLGVNTVWLLPFYPSPRRDDGYDIAGYTDVHPDYGTLDDARRFIDEAHRRGLRVVTELVINHTSDQHPWFQRARRAPPNSPERNFYVWSDTDTAYAGTRIIFCDTEKSNWTWDAEANAFFWHRFYSHQPDLNFDNPQVLEEVLKIMGFWLDIGVDGLRFDAVPYLVEREGTSNENLPETHAILKTIRAELDRRYPNRMFLAEANMWPEDVQQYFGDGDECHMAFHFPLMPRMYMALAQEDRFPMTDILRQTPEIPPQCQWAIFLRNHDELTLEMVTDRERDYLWNHYAAEKRARINLGIRRRLAPLLQRDRRRIELLNSFLLSMPGTPVIYYGDEIGMGDNIHLGDRDGVRTPMQWTPDRNGGFSRADPARLVLPPIMDAVYGFGAVNVEAQHADPHSLLNWMRRLLQVRAQHRAFGRGTLRLLSPRNRTVFAYLREYEDPQGGKETILCVANVSGAAQAVELDLSEFRERVPVEMLRGAPFPPIGALTYLLSLPPYGFYWFVLASDTGAPSWHTQTPQPLPEYRTLVVREGIDDLLRGKGRNLLENEVLPQYLAMRRWFADKQGRIAQVRIAHTTAVPVLAPRKSSLPLVLAELEVDSTQGSQRYLLPVGFSREADIGTGLAQQLALARLRRGAQLGYLTDAFALDSLALSFLALMKDGAVLPSGDGTLRFAPTAAAAAVIEAVERAAPQGGHPSIRRLGAEQSNSSLVIGEAVVLKIIRKLSEGTHPEAEMGRALTERGFASTPATLGDVTRVAADGTRCTMAVLQAYIPNQGDAWEWTLHALERAIARAAMEAAQALRGSHGGGTPGDESSPGDAGAAPPPLPESAYPPDADALPAPDPMAQLRAMAARIGQRLGEMHALLAQDSEDPAFSPEAVDEYGAANWADDARRQLEAALEVLERRKAGDPPLAAADAERADALLARSQSLPTQLQRLAAASDGALRIRIHGDFHLGQVLVVGDDAWLVDFEGEPARSMAQRRAKGSPWRDVAGMLRSFDYAAEFAQRNAAATGDAAAQESAARIARAYLDASREAFLAAYREFAPPRVQQGADGLLRLFTLEKAAYELCYEAAMRPDWLPVPLRGLAAIAEEMQGELSRMPPTDFDLHLFGQGRHRELGRLLGAQPMRQDGRDGTRFAVWAPSARRVAVVGDFNGWNAEPHPMEPQGSSGIWMLFVPGVGPGARYKYAIHSAAGVALPFKADPVARATELPPATASVVASADPFPWTDAQWMARRGERQSAGAPISVYELHAGSWLRIMEEGGRSPRWDELAQRLIPYAAGMGFTHIELLPVMEHPFSGSWGYQPLSLFAPSARWGTPEDFARFVDACHGAGLGVILDWVPAHFPNDAHGLARFDGSALYEHEDPREGYHPDWNTLIYNFGRHEVRGFLIASALEWLERYHVDGLRVDAVASMLYRDYSRKAGEWVPNRHGGRENLEAVDFLRELNETVRERCPGAIVVAEESTAWPGVTAPATQGGLGFAFKWNMGWMHDTLHYFAHETVHRRWHHDALSFSLVYAFSERFMLPLSHDEVVHGKGSLLARMPGDDWQQFANLRALFGLMWAHPGKKLLFMGSELAQRAEWNHDGSVDWDLLDRPAHRGVQRLVRDLNRLYARLPALHARDAQPEGFRWLIGDDRDNSVFAWLRIGAGGDAPVLCICNLTPVPRHGYCIGVPQQGGGRWIEILNTDAACYGGSGAGNAGAVESVPHPLHGQPQSLRLTLPPLAVLMLQPLA